MTEPNIRDFAGNWTGTGAIISAGDDEQICLDAGENMVSEVVYTDTRTVQLTQNKYDPSGDSAILYYRHGATEAACLIAGWNLYGAPFASLGYVQIKLDTV